jgi:poly(ribitol-phosphate) beta-N-acetylglucosaminyltransferase
MTTTETTRPTTNEVKVTVVVPVYNPGANIEGLISSLAGQSLPASQFEVIFVDDGSTDDTPQRLERACARNTNMRTSTIPNSGWPGRPRNVGTDLASGDYVFYADNDDELYPEALERMHALASANGSDIVYGKIVRTGRPTPYWPLWLRTIGFADPVEDRLVQSRTVHKLFRRQFLIDHGIRFPEGKVRLEDFSFMGQAIPRANVISVLADYPCYRWIHRPDGTNNSMTLVKPNVYWGYFTAALQTFADASGPGPLLDAVRLVAAEQAFSRFPPSAYLERTAAGQRGAFDAVRDYVSEQLPPALDHRLPVLKRVRYQALRDGDKDRFDALQRLRQAFTMEFEVDSLAWQGETLRIVARATLRGADSVALMEQTRDPAGPDGADRPLLLPLPDELRGDDASRRLRPEDRGAFELTVRHRDTGLEWPMHGSSKLELETTPGGVRLRVRLEARVNPGNGYFGEPLGDGIWDVMARAQFLGESTLVNLPAPGPRAGGTVASGDRRARAYVTKGGKVALKLSHETVAAQIGRPLVQAAAWDGNTLRLDLSGAPRTGASIVTRHRAGGDGVGVPVRSGMAKLRLDHLRVGEPADAYLRLESAAGVRDERLTLGGSVTVAQRAPYAVSAGPTGGLTVVRLAPGQALPGPVTTPPAETGRRPLPELPNATGVLTMLPTPMQRVARRVRRRLKARLK